MKKILILILIVSTFGVGKSLQAQEVEDPQKKIAELEAQLKSLKESKPTEIPIAQTEKMEAGWVVRLGAGPSDLTTIPTDVVGSFVMTEPSYTLTSHYKDKSLSFFKSNAAYLFQGWFQAKEAGRYTFVADIDLAPMRDDYKDYMLICNYWFELEGSKVLTSGEVSVPMRVPTITKKNLVGGVELVPGKYKARQWLSCKVPEETLQNQCYEINRFPESIKGKFDCKTELYRPSDHVAVTLKVKGPKDVGPVDLPGELIVHKSE